LTPSDRSIFLSSYFSKMNEYVLISKVANFLNCKKINIILFFLLCFWCIAHRAANFKNEDQPLGHEWGIHLLTFYSLYKMLKWERIVPLFWNFNLFHMTSESKKWFISLIKWMRSHIQGFHTYITKLFKSCCLTLIQVGD
jgi:hypothetical protein